MRGGRERETKTEADTEGGGSEGLILELMSSLAVHGCSQSIRDSEGGMLKQPGRAKCQ